MTAFDPRAVTGTSPELQPIPARTVRRRATTVVAPSVPVRAGAPEAPTLVAKHVFDRVAAAVLLVVVLPLLLAIAAAVRLSSQGPVIYRQRRVGRHGASLELLKFRTMAPVSGDGAFRPGAGRGPGGVEGEDRRTRVGRVLRRTSLDELPQLVNVLRGEMSLVGPRPERPEFVQLFADEVPGYADRLRMPVGMTGLAQVRGLRGQTSIADRVAADNEYIDGWHLGLDLKVLLLTVLAVLRMGE